MNGDEAVFEEAAKLAREGRAFAIAGILTAVGSTPRSKARMLVRSDGTSIGTIGGGPVEAHVVACALECIKAQESRTLRYDLGAASEAREARPAAMDCGGSMEIYIDAVAARRQLVVVGAGHVGLALARLADFAGFRVSVADSRAELLTAERFPMAEAFYGQAGLAAALKTLPADPGASLVIATHAEDETALRAALTRSWGYIGLLGSRKKTVGLKKKLMEEGIACETLAKIRAPVGLDIGAETPEEIAIAVLAEILTDLRSKSGAHLSALAPCGDIQP